MEPSSKTNDGNAIDMGHVKLDWPRQLLIHCNNQSYHGK